MMTGGEALVRAIKLNGVDTVFGIPGLQLNAIMDGFYQERDTIGFLHCRHEQGAAYMAFGYAQSTGRAGTCVVVPGPGVLNAATALATAYSCNAPVLCIAGQIPSDFIGRNLGPIHEIDDQPGTMAAVTKWQGRAETPAQAPGVIDEAFREMLGARQRPVLVEMASDIMAEDAEVALLGPANGGAAPEPDPDAVETAAALLGAAENPAIFVGGGIFGAEDELLALAEMLEAPIIMSQHGLGAADCRHYLAQGIQVGFEMWPKIDCVLAVGTRFIQPMLQWGYDADIKLIRIDPDAGQSVEPWAPDVHMATTAKTGLAAIAARAGRHNRKRAPREDEFNTLKAAAAKRLAEALAPQHAYCMAIREQLPEDGIVCFGVTQLGFYSWWGFPIYQPRTMIQPGYAATLGFAFPTALGAQVANPGKKVVAITGDGGFLFAVQELATAVQHKINLVTLVFNDNRFGNVHRQQSQLYGEHHIAVELHNPDFMKLADSFGLMGLRTDSPAGLSKALAEAFKADGPVLIEVEVGEFPDPFPSMMRRKVR